MESVDAVTEVATSDRLDALNKLDTDNRFRELKEKALSSLALSSLIDDEVSEDDSAGTVETYRNFIIVPNNDRYFSSKSEIDEYFDYLSKV